jgi:hypothetical protein
MPGVGGVRGCGLQPGGPREAFALQLTGKSVVVRLVCPSCFKARNPANDRTASESVSRSEQSHFWSHISTYNAVDQG